jgi:ribosomal protein L11 methylase PrmA
MIGPKNLKDTKIIELGAGIGYTSIIAKQLGAGEVVITDGDEGVLILAQKNIDLNFNPRSVKKISTAQLRWNTDDEKIHIDSTGENPWDYIVIADCTYKKAAWPDLVSSIVHLSSPKTITIVAGEPRSVGETEGFLTEVEKQGLTWREEKLPNFAKTNCNLQCPHLYAIMKN